ncbi:hypothetical protein CVS37_30730 [Burkholderia lata]|nr:hypothetical protein CVS37_30730 [Burkholderia lata]
MGRQRAIGLRHGRSAFAYGSVGFNIGISVAAAPTGHQRTSTPKPDGNGKRVRQPAKCIDQLTPNVNRRSTGAAPAKHIDGAGRGLSDETDFADRAGGRSANFALTAPVTL